jgi:hypothetical protein
MFSEFSKTSKQRIKVGLVQNKAAILKVTKFQILIEKSQEAEIPNLSFLVNPTRTTFSLCPIKHILHFPVKNSQSRTVLSLDPEITYFWLDERAKLLTHSVCPTRLLSLKFFEMFQIETLDPPEFIIKYL